VGGLICQLCGTCQLGSCFICKQVARWVLQFYRRGHPRHVDVALPFDALEALHTREHSLCEPWVFFFLSLRNRFHAQFELPEVWELCAGSVHIGPGERSSISKTTGFESTGVWYLYLPLGFEGIAKPSEHMIKLHSTEHHKEHR
jgi:hypothetical protein